MTDVFLYADETGNLDYEAEGKVGATPFFGFGTAAFYGDHGSALFQGLMLRCELEGKGVRVPNGFHAVDDSAATRNDVFALIQEQKPRFDTTFLLKKNAYPYVRTAGQMRLYKLAWYLHFKEIARQVSEPSDRLFVIAGTFGTAVRKAQARAAMEDVCSQVDRDITLCVWPTRTAWGLQVADYALWAVQRTLDGKPCSWYPHAIEPTLQSTFTPWGRA